MCSGRSWGFRDGEMGRDLMELDKQVCPNSAEEIFIRRTIKQYFGKKAASGVLLPLKAGMTNDSFLFDVQGKKYIFRCNGKGTELLIDRENEKAVYEMLRCTDITEDIVALSIEPGYKISRYYEDSRVCDPMNMDEVHSCMKALRSFHELRLCGASKFNPFEAVIHYEEVLNGRGNVCSEYMSIRDAVFSLRPFLAPFLENRDTLCHIDSISDNFLFVEGRESPYLIDWEYAACSDPLVDVAMFAIYANYAEVETTQLLAGYFPEGVDEQIKARVYAYMAVGGLLWSLWCAYKSSLGTSFGVYAENQLRFAKTYPAKVHDLLGDM